MGSTYPALAKGGNVLLANHNNDGVKEIGVTVTGVNVEVMVNSVAVTGPNV